MSVQALSKTVDRLLNLVRIADPDGLSIRVCAPQPKETGLHTASSIRILIRVQHDLQRRVIQNSAPDLGTIIKFTCQTVYLCVALNLYSASLISEGRYK